MVQAIRCPRFAVDHGDHDSHYLRNDRSCNAAGRIPVIRWIPCRVRLLGYPASSFQIGRTALGARHELNSALR
jgi:hypothetical protein